MLQDLSPRYASVLLGITNTAGALPGVFGVAATGYILEQTGSWELAMFIPAIVFYLAGTAVYTTWGSGEVQPFNDWSATALAGSDREGKGKIE